MAKRVSDQQPAPERRTSRSAATRKGKAFCTIPLTPDVKMQLDLLAVRTRRTRESLGQEAVADLLAKYGKTQRAPKTEK